MVDKIAANAAFATASAGAGARVAKTDDTSLVDRFTDSLSLDGIKDTVGDVVDAGEAVYDWGKGIVGSVLDWMGLNLIMAVASHEEKQRARREEARKDDEVAYAQIDRHLSAKRAEAEVAYENLRRKAQVAA